MPLSLVILPLVRKAKRILIIRNEKDLIFNRIPSNGDNFFAKKATKKRLPRFLALLFFRLSKKQLKKE